MAASWRLSTPGLNSSAPVVWCSWPPSSFWTGVPIRPALSCRSRICSQDRSQVAR